MHRIYYPTRHRWDKRTFKTAELAVLHAQKRAACFAVYKRDARAGVASAEHASCPKLGSDCTAWCNYRTSLRKGGGR